MAPLVNQTCILRGAVTNADSTLSIMGVNLSNGTIYTPGAVTVGAGAVALGASGLCNAGGAPGCCVYGLSLSNSGVSTSFLACSHALLSGSLLVGAAATIGGLLTTSSLTVGTLASPSNSPSATYSTASTGTLYGTTTVRGTYAVGSNYTATVTHDLCSSNYIPLVTTHSPSGVCIASTVTGMTSSNFQLCYSPVTAPADADAAGSPMDVTFFYQVVLRT